MTTAAKPAVLLVGCGDIAQRLALLLHHDYRLTGLRRRAAHLPPYIEALAADLCDEAALRQALAGRCFDYVVVTLTPGERSEERYRAVYVDGTRHLLRALQGSPRLLFVSSTSVYGQHAGELIDEQSPAQTENFSGRLLREAEQQVLGGPFAASCVRFSGIYGPGRERLLRSVREQTVNADEAAQWSNRIHADDCARVLAFLIECWEDGVVPDPVYIASDECPVQLGEVWQWLAERMEKPLVLPPAWRDGPATGKRASSARLRAQGFHFLYADFRAGYAAMLAQHN